MFTRWQLHRDLANSIGDPALIDATTINNGARYSAALRDSYLTRAMLEIQNKSLAMVSQYPRHFQVQAIAHLFPQSIKRSEGIRSSGDQYEEILLQDQDGNTENAAYVLSARLVDTNNTTPTTFYPVAVKDSLEANSLLNTRNVQRPDPFIVHENRVSNGAPVYDIRFYDVQQDSDNTYYLEIEYLPQAPDVSQLAITDIIWFEDRFASQVLSFAKMYAMIDDQNQQIHGMALQGGLQ